jgi:hypothetical protein
MRQIEDSYRGEFWDSPHPAGGAGSREKQMRSADTIVSLAIAHALRDCPEAVQAEVLKILRRHTELLEENQELRRRVTQLQMAGLTHGRR